VWSFIVPGVYEEAAIMKNAYFTNAFAIRQVKSYPCTIRAPFHPLPP
jgi:hypothetical protein